MRQKEREEFISVMSREGVALNVSRAFLRAGATLQRLAEAQCNGDYPFDNGERPVILCVECGTGCVKWAMKRNRQGQRICPDCKTTARIKAFAVQHGLSVITNGDPRGAVLTVITPSGREVCAG